MSDQVEFETLVGEHLLSGADSGILRADTKEERYSDANTFVFVLDDAAYLAIEDENDSYRSALGTFERVPVERVANRFAPVRVLARLKTRGEYTSCVILELIDIANGQTVLEVGTDNTGDYYPWFVAAFWPDRLSMNVPIPRQPEGDNA